MGDFNIQVEAPAPELHQELLDAIDEADLDWQAAQAARIGMNAALSFLDVVGDHSVDAGLSVTIAGTSGDDINVSVTAVPSTEEPVTTNVPGLEDEEEADEIPPLMIAGQVANPQTGDPIVDNFPGHPDAEWHESMVEEAVIHEPPAEDELASVEDQQAETRAQAESTLVKEQETVPEDENVEDVENRPVDREAQDNQMAGLESPELTVSKTDEPDEEITVAPGDELEVTKAPAPDFKGMTIEQVLEAVGDDRQLAEDALEAEESNARPRPTLITQLEDIIDEGGA